MDRLRSLFRKILALLRVRPIVGGLEISDQVLRFTYFDGTTWQLHAVRLEPGVLEDGRVKDRERFLESLVALKDGSKIGGRDKSKKITVVVAVSSAGVYSQMFSLPALSGDSLAKAVDLNLQMASPDDAAKTYSGWEVVGKDEATSRLDVLSAFADRGVVNDVVQILFEAGFLTMAVEPRSLALTRVLHDKGTGVDTKKPYLLLDIDNVGIDFLVVRNGLPYFEYTNAWKDIMDARGEIAAEKFETELAASLRQVINFYNQHWAEPISVIVIAAAAFHEQIEKTIAEHVAMIPAVRLTLEMGQPVSSDWLVALGCSLRDDVAKGGGKEINFLGEDLRDRFRAEAVVHFLEFWRVVVPVALGILIIAFGMTGVILASTKTAVESSPGYTLIPAQGSQVAALIASSTAFNNEVAAIQAIEFATSTQSSLVGVVQAVAAANGVQISRMTSGGSGTPVVLSGIATSENQISAFKSAMMSNPRIMNVDLPLTGIRIGIGNYSFSMTFSYE